MTQTLEMERDAALRERRATIRVACFLPASYQPHPPGSSGSGRITSLCVQGLGLLGSHNTQEGAQVVVQFFLPGEDHNLRVTGVVRWTEDAPATQEQRFGLEFSNLDDTARFCLEAFIQGHLHAPQPLRGINRRLHQLRHDFSPEVLQAARFFVAGIVLLSLFAWVIAVLR